MNQKIPIGDCRDTLLIEEIFRSVQEFVRQIELNGNNFDYGSVTVRYNEKTDIHIFFK
jgi:hypothetical protein